LKVISNTDIVNQSGCLLIEKGKTYDVEPIIREGYYGKGSGVYYPEKITGFKFDGLTYSDDVFKIK
jgi:hypothetical protein